MYARDLNGYAMCIKYEFKFCLIICLVFIQFRILDRTYVGTY